jgi:hypothetical protein
MMEDFLYEFAQVRRVFNSCTTREQVENATKWAKNWSKRMAELHPNIVPNWQDLFDQIISE